MASSGARRLVGGGAAAADGGNGHQPTKLKPVVTPKAPPPPWRRRLSRDGRIRLPRDICRAGGLLGGEDVYLLPSPDGLLILPQARGERQVTFPASTPGRGATGDPQGGVPLTIRMGVGGRITIPHALRKALRWTPNTELVLHGDAGSAVRISAVGLHKVVRRSQRRRKALSLRSSPNPRAIQALIANPALRLVLRRASEAMHALPARLTYADFWRVMLDAVGHRHTPYCIPILDHFARRRRCRVILIYALGGRRQRAYAWRFADRSILVLIPRASKVYFLGTLRANGASNSIIVDSPSALRAAVRRGAWHQVEAYLAVHGELPSLECDLLLAALESESEPVRLAAISGLSGIGRERAPASPDSASVRQNNGDSV